MAKKDGPLDWGAKSIKSFFSSSLQDTWTTRYKISFLPQNFLRVAMSRARKLYVVGKRILQNRRREKKRKE